MAGTGLERQLVTTPEPGLRSRSRQRRGKLFTHANCRQPGPPRPNPLTTRGKTWRANCPNCKNNKRQPMKLLFLHGLESGPRGSKCQALEQVFGDVLAPDCSGIADERQRLAIIRRRISAATSPFLVVGSSMGGLMALLLQQAQPQAVAGLVLCAPALHRGAAHNLDFDHLPPTRVIHGRADTVVPLAVSLPLRGSTAGGG